jgi:hypothetical protein
VYRLFIDEVGHDNLKSAKDPNERKLDIFETENIVLHRREIIDKNEEPFDKLRDPTKRKKFDESLLSLIETCDYAAIAVLIDKKEHIEKYTVWRHQPYHYCLTAMLERYVMHLEAIGDEGDVMAEWRGVLPNRKLEAAYQYIYKNGNDNIKADRFQTRLSSAQLKIKTKSANCGTATGGSCREPGMQISTLHECGVWLEGRENTERFEIPAEVGMGG